MPSHEFNSLPVGQQGPANLPMREHLNLQEVRFTSMQGDVTSSSWVTASITLYEVRNTDAAPNIAYWALGIYPHGASHRAQMVYLTGEDWVIKWEETTRYCLIVDSLSEFLRLVYMCCNIRMYVYTGLLFA
ncbi:hypothetical protein FKP32DRAFT_1602230 [Trametes sanguinea]|nr:hypothetical protein FKP32DRAFT_1602230 [Trametes sanguinea]